MAPGPATNPVMHRARLFLQRTAGDNVRPDRLEGCVRIFVSWSLERSGKIASALQQWIPKVMQAVQPWISSASIEPGVRWGPEVAGALQDMQFGVICLTPENTGSHWILFEAGALSKAVSESRVVPYLFGFEPHELKGPLAQFQAVQANRSGTYQLVSAINAVAAERSIPSDILSETFDVWWPRLESDLNGVASVEPVQASATPARSMEDMLGEVLTLLRSQRFATQKSEAEGLETFTNMPKPLGDRIRDLRSERGLRQQDLARLAGVSQPYVSQLENGFLIPPINVLGAIAQVLGLTAEELIGSSRVAP